MKWKPVLFSTGALGLSLVLGCEAPVAVTEPPADLIAPAPRPKPKPRTVREDRACYCGAVSVVGPDWVELGAGWNGNTLKGKQLDGNKAKRISATGTKPGGDSDGNGSIVTHRLSDLKAGDMVQIFTDIGPGGDEWTDEIWIQRRPGGKIPPMWDFERAQPHPHIHLQQQAEQDWEEKRIPIPRKYCAPDGTCPWTNPPYPLPVAPQPREVPPAPADVAAGRVLFKKLCCAKCHTSAADAEGPHLAGLFGSRVPLTGGGTAIADEEYVRESILKPRAKVVRGYEPRMLSFEGQMSEAELGQLVEYLKSLKVAEKNEPVADFPAPPGAPSGPPPIPVVKD